jgi:hypothetical protein
VPGYGYKGDADADTRCTSWNKGYDSQCYIKGGNSCADATATPTSKSSGPTSTPRPTPPGCPIDNGDGRVNNCQASCQSPYPNSKPDGNEACTKAYGSKRGACCTSSTSN